MNISECMFEKICKARGIRFERIVPDGISKAADYLIWLNCTEVVVEVKQIDSSDHESQLFSGAEINDSPFIIDNVHSRIRNKFDKAKKQLKGSSRDSLPRLFVLFDKTGGLSGMDNEDFLIAMYGNETVRFSFRISNLRPVIHKFAHIFGGQRKVGPSHNKSVSGFCRMLIDDEGEPYLLLFHNM